MVNGGGKRGGCNSISLVCPVNHSVGLSDLKGLVGYTQALRTNPSLTKWIFRPGFLAHGFYHIELVLRPTGRDGCVSPLAPGVWAQIEVGD